MDEPAGAEAELVRAAQQDVKDFLPLYDRYRDRLYRYLLSRIGDPDEAADLLQQVFLQAMDRLSQYQPGRGPFAAWLFGIARNSATNFRQRRRPVPSCIQPGPNEAAVSMGGSGFCPVTRTRSASMIHLRAGDGSPALRHAAPYRTSRKTLSGRESLPSFGVAARGVFQSSQVYEEDGS